MPQSKNTFDKLHIASAKKTSTKGTARGIPLLKQKHLGLTSSRALWRHIPTELLIQAVEDNGRAMPTIAAV